MTTRALILAIAILVSSCGGGRRSMAPASCTVTASVSGFSSMSCVEYTMASQALLDGLRMSCPPAPGTLPDAGPVVAMTSYSFAMEGCLLSGAVGGCQSSIAGTTVTATTWYYDAALVPTFQMLCTQQMGTWVSP